MVSPRVENMFSYKRIVSSLGFFFVKEKVKKTRRTEENASGNHNETDNQHGAVVKELTGFIFLLYCRRRNESITQIVKG